MNASLREPVKQAKLMQAFKAIANSGQYVDGAYTFKLQRMFAAMLRGNAAVAFNSRGSALYSLFSYYASLGYKSIAVQNNAFFAVGSMALQAGLSVYLVDSGPEHPSMGIDALREVLGSNRGIRLVMLYHVGGWVAKDYLEITALCAGEGITLLEDCSSVLGVEGSYVSPGASEASVWSFQAGSVAPVGSGAVVSTGNIDLRSYMQKFHTYGKHINNRGVYVYGPGYDMRMSEWDACVACIQLEDLPNILARRECDALALQSIAPRLLNGPCNNQSYPVDPLHANKRFTVPPIYGLTDQLATSLGPHPKVFKPNLVHSARWAQNHRCLPIGETMYEGLTHQQILDKLTKK